MIGLLFAGVMALVCVLVHFEALLLTKRLTYRVTRLRWSLLVTWIILLSAHVLQIWLYAAVYWLCGQLGIGQLVGIDGALDYVYFSSVVYTTLGFGDIVPDAGVSVLAGSEALVGLCLIAWSATVTYGHFSNWRET
jgi:hypothetical protein